MARKRSRSALALRGLSFSPPMAILRCFSHVLTFPRSRPTIEPRPRQKKRWEFVRTAIAYYGAYSISETEKTLMVRINGSTFANLIGGPEQKRIITSLTAEELKFTNPRTPAGVTLQTVWERAKAP